MLPENQQMETRANRSAETALDLLINQVRAVWESRNYTATLLALDIIGAFDRIIRQRLMYFLRAKGSTNSITKLH